MDDSKADTNSSGIFFVFIKYLVAIVLSITLLEFSGIDATQANVFSFNKFSLSIFILFSICLYAFNNIIENTLEWGKNKDNAQ